MKCILISLRMSTIAIIFCVTSAHAQKEKKIPCFGVKPCYSEGGEIPIADQHLFLLGKGFKGKKSNQVIATACVGKNFSCDLLRFVYFPTAEQGFWVGPYLKLKNLKAKNGEPVTAPQALQHDFKKFIKEDFDGKTWVSLVSMGVIFTTAFVVGASGGSPIIFAGLIALGVGHLVSGSRGDMHEMDPTRLIRQGFVYRTHESVIDQDGWNWAADPVRTKEKFVKGFLESMTAGRANLIFESFEVDYYNRFNQDHSK